MECGKKTRDFDLVLRKRASPKHDVQGIRHSDTRDLRLVPSEFVPEPGSGVLPAYCHVSVGTVLVQRRDKIHFVLARQVDLMSVVYVCHGS